MSLTAFQRYRRIQQVEEMKPENIEEPKEEVIEKTPEVVTEIGEVIEPQENTNEEEEQPEVVEVENENEGTKQEVIDEPKPATRGRGRRA